MNINDLNGESKWLRAADLQGKIVRVQISDWDLQKFKQLDGTEKTQIVLTFVGKEKKLGLNATNRKMIGSIHGDETDDWIGKEIVLTPAKTMNPSGQLVDCIRVAYEAPKKSPPVPKLKKIVDERNPPDDMNDEVPF